MDNRTMRSGIVLLFLLSLCACALNGADYPEPEHAPVLLYFCPRAAVMPKVDGVLDDECWKAAPIITDFGSIHIGQGPARKQAFMRMVYDDDAVYLAVQAIEPDIKKLKVITGRDSSVFSGDCIEIYLRPDLSKLTRYQLVTNAAGERWDAWITGQARSDKPDLYWGAEAKWHAAGQVGKEEWTVEVRLPHADFGLPHKPGDAFGINLVRLTWSTGKEFSAWACATYEQKDFRYWAHFVFGGPGVDEMKVVRRLVPDYGQRLVSWPSARGVVLLDHGKRKEMDYVRASTEDLRELDAVIARLQAGLQRLEAAKPRLRDLPRELKALQDQRARLANRVRTERFSAIGLRQFRDQVPKIAQKGADLEWDMRSLQLLTAAAEE